MKRWIKLILSVMWIGSLLLAAVSLGHGQSEPEAGGDLVLQQVEKSDKTIKIENGKTLKAWATDGNIYEGKLTRVTDSSFLLNKVEIPFSKTTKIKTADGSGSKIAGVAGLIMGIVGTVIGFLLGLLGVYAMDTAPSNANGCGQVFLGAMVLVLGIAVGILGIIFLIVGVIAFAIGKAVARSFSFPGKWKLKGRAN